MDPIAEKEFLHVNYFSGLTEIQKEKCEGPLTLEECETSLNTFKLNKSPGNDGLTVEFYKYFWHLLKYMFIECFNEAFEEGNLTASQKQSVIILIDKKGKDRMLLRNWRPISLLNMDYKIASKAIANRIKLVLPNIIHSDQKGYVNGRYIGEVIRITKDIMFLTKLRNESGILVAVDFLKAFDSLEFSFLFKTLELFNFGTSLLRWINLFYNNISSCIMNSGFSSGYFEIGRGVRQGDPLSGYLFIMCMEVFANNIRHSSNIKGIDVEGQEIKLVQYADDTTGILADEASVKNFLNKLNMFKNISGLQINIGKTEIIWLGSERHNKKKPCSLNCSKQIKLLGIVLSYNEAIEHRENLSSKLEEMKKTLNLWKMRNLTLKGRILLAKTLGFSKLQYVASIMQMPNIYIKEVETILFSFI